MRIYQGDVWGIETAGWFIEPDDTGLTLCPADVDAALQISDYQKRDGSVTTEELLEGARERAPQGTPVKPVVCGPFVGYRCEYVDEEGLIWRVWHPGRGRTELFMTYHTSPENRDKHREAADWMFSTLTEGRP
ncbi:MAG TPA: hypothetical protein VKD71_09540 [Gemmataceae bacterium]|nr:hypothetical protein [Gemmataceae bacterium]